MVITPFFDVFGSFNYSIITAADLIILKIVLLVTETASTLETKIPLKPIYSAAVSEPTVLPEITEGTAEVNCIEVVEAVEPVKLKLYEVPPVSPTVLQSTFATVVIDQEGPAS